MRVLIEAIELTETTPALAGHLVGMIRVQPDGTNRGSFVEGLTSWETTKSFLAETAEWSEIAHTELPEGSTIHIATYFRAEIPEGFTARTGILRVRDLTESQLGQVVVREGAHPADVNLRGLELVLPWEGELAETTEVWAITGPTKEVEGHVLWTWYPGPVTPRLDGRHLPVVEKLAAGEQITAEELESIGDLAVKLQLG